MVTTVLHSKENHGYTLRCLLIITQSMALCPVWIPKPGCMDPWNDLPFSSYRSIIKHLVSEAGHRLWLTSTPTHWRNHFLTAAVPWTLGCQQTLKPTGYSPAGFVEVTTLLSQSEAQLQTSWDSQASDTGMSLFPAPEGRLAETGARGSSVQQMCSLSKPRGTTTCGSVWSFRFSQGTWAGMT